MQSLFLSYGAHRLGEPGRCTLERVSEFAGEQLTDHPVCAHPELAALCRAANDALPQQARQLLAVLIEPLASSANLHLQREDLARVATALRAVEQRPRAATASVFVSTVQLAITHGVPEGAPREAPPQQRRPTPRADSALGIKPEPERENPRTTAPPAPAPRASEPPEVQQAQRTPLGSETILGVHRVLRALDQLSARSRPAVRLLEVTEVDQRLEITLEEEPQYAHAHCR